MMGVAVYRGDAISTNASSASSAVKQSKVDNQRRAFSQCRTCVLIMCRQANGPRWEGAEP
jgi:hypothetical protein